MINCLVCNVELNGLKGMPVHLKKHNLSYFDYVLNFTYLGVRPTCKCGCGQETKLYKGYFRDFRPRHSNIKHKQVIIKCNTCGKERTIAENLAKENKTYHCSMECRNKDPEYINSLKRNEVSLDEVKQRIFKTHSDEMNIDESTFVNTYTKCRFVDKDYGEFFNTPRNIYNQKQSHPSRRIGKLRKAFLKNLNEVSRIISLVPAKWIGKKEEYQDNKSKLTLLCGKCNKVWFACFNKITQGRGCHHCKSEKQRQTLIINYGVDVPCKNLNIAKKAAQNSARKTIVHDWKNRELVCQSTNEIAVIRWLSETKQDFDWQIPFRMPDGKLYLIDLYIPRRNLYIEIKGTFRDWVPNSCDREKWDWFHSEHLNSELWDEQKLKDLGLWPLVLTVRREKRKQRKIREQQQNEIISNIYCNIT